MQFRPSPAQRTETWTEDVPQVRFVPMFPTFPEPLTDRRSHSEVPRQLSSTVTFCPRLTEEAAAPRRI